MRRVPCRRPYCKATETTPVGCPWNKREQEGAARTTTAVGSVFFLSVGSVFFLSYLFLSAAVQCVCGAARKEGGDVSKKRDSSE